MTSQAGSKLHKSDGKKRKVKNGQEQRGKKYNVVYWLPAFKHFNPLLNIFYK